MIEPEPLQAGKTKMSGETGWKKAALAALTQRIAALFAIGTHAIHARRRGSPTIVKARQTIIYLAHIALGLDVMEIADALNRDRSSVALALKTIEDARDDPAFDALLDCLEKTIGVWRGEGR